MIILEFHNAQALKRLFIENNIQLNEEEMGEDMDIIFVIHTISC